MKYPTWGDEAELGINFCHIHMGSCGITAEDLETYY